MQRHRVKDEVIVIDDAEAPEARPGQDEPRVKCEACAALAALNRRNQRLEADLLRVRCDLQAVLRTKLHEMLALIECHYLAAVSPPHEEPPAKRARAV